jgi:hypothetical protein
MIPYFLETLKNTPDGDGSLLENTMVVYGSPMGDSNLHNHKRVPFFVAGHAGGALKGGMHVRAADGTPLAELASERREILTFDKFPPQLVHAFLAAEDRRFYEHQGID